MFREATQKAYDPKTGRLAAGPSARYRPISKVTLESIERVIEQGSITHEGFL